MTLGPNTTLYLALLCYAAGTGCALLALFRNGAALQKAGWMAMAAGFVCHTIWIGTICTITKHPPLTNLAEAAGFLAWTVLAVEGVLFLMYRVEAAAFFVYPLVLILVTVSAVVHEPFAHVSPAMRSGLFLGHILFTTLGVAGLLIGLAFTLLAYLQDRSLKSKRRGRLWEWIPSLSVCRLVSHRALATGFSIYTIGLLAGVLWSYHVNSGPLEMRIKEIGAVIAWIFFAILLQSTVDGAIHRRRTIVASAGALIGTAVAILGIHHG